MAELCFESVSKIYSDRIPAVDRMTLAVSDAQWVVLVGPSGCGKTTTLRLVAGLERLDAGTIRIGTRVVNGLLPKDRNVSMVFQSGALYPHLSVYGNMAFALKLRGVRRPEIEQRVKRVAAMLGIERLLAAWPGALSGGERQRVTIGRAIVRDPECFLFDEPLSQLDAPLRLEMRGELRGLHNRLRWTTLYVTHDQEEAMSLGDLVAVMDRGRIHQCGPPLVVYHQPINRFVAGFMGTPPMNFFPGRLEAIGSSIRFVGSDVVLRLSEDQRARFVKLAGQEVVCGVRPEAFALSATERRDRDAQSVDVRVEAVEPLGRTMDLRCRTAVGAPLIVRVAAHPFQCPARVTIYVQSEDIYLFEPGPYGANLALSCGACR